MWLSRKLSQHEMQDVASAQGGTVTLTEIGASEGA